MNDIYTDADLELLEVEDAADRATYPTCDQFTPLPNGGDEECWYCTHPASDHK